MTDDNTGNNRDADLDADTDTATGDAPAADTAAAPAAAQNDSSRPALVDESAFEDDGDDDDDDDIGHFSAVASDDDDNGAPGAGDGTDGGDADGGDGGEGQAPAVDAEIPLHLIDADALWVVRRLRAKGFEAYLTGGCVRDLLLGKTPKDFDVATAAHPNQVKNVFRNCRLIGRRFRLAHVFFSGGKVIETATFRANPTDELEDLPQDLLVERDNVFGDVEQDARRRDLTINGLFYDPIAGKVLDYVDGRRDLDARLIRTIGDPDVRFQEDPVRILRAIKFATRLGFDIEDKTLQAMKNHVDGLLRCAPARLQEELLRLMTSGHARAALDMAEEIGVLRELLPELLEALSMPLEGLPRAAPVAPVAEAEVAVDAAVDASAEGTAVEASAEGAAVDASADSNTDSNTDGAAAAAESDAVDAPGAGALAAAAVEAAPPTLPTPEERRARLRSLLDAIDAARSRGVDFTSASVFATLLLPAWEALHTSTTPLEPWFNALFDRWTERIRLTRHDRERIVQVLIGLSDLAPHRRRPQTARGIVARPSFRESLLVMTFSLYARGLPLDEIAHWKVVAHHVGVPYKQPRLGERPRMRAAGKAPGGGRGGRDRGDRGGDRGDRGGDRGGRGGDRGGRRRRYGN